MIPAKRKEWTRRLLGAAPWLLLALPATGQEDRWQWNADGGYWVQERYDSARWPEDDTRLGYDPQESEAYADYEDSVIYGTEGEWRYGTHRDPITSEWQEDWYYEPDQDGADTGWGYADFAGDASFGAHNHEYEYFTEDWWGDDADDVGYSGDWWDGDEDVGHGPDDMSTDPGDVGFFDEP